MPYGKGIHFHRVALSITCLKYWFIPLYNDFAAFVTNYIYVVYVVVFNELKMFFFKKDCMTVIQSNNII